MVGVNVKATLTSLNTVSANIVVHVSSNAKPLCLSH